MGRRAEEALVALFHIENLERSHQATNTGKTYFSDSGLTNKAFLVRSVLNVCICVTAGVHVLHPRLPSRARALRAVEVDALQGARSLRRGHGDRPEVHLDALHRRLRHQLLPLHHRRENLQGPTEGHSVQGKPALWRRQGHLAGNDDSGVGEVVMHGLSLPSGSYPDLKKLGTTTLVPMCSGTCRVLRKKTSCGDIVRIMTLSERDPPNWTEEMMTGELRTPVHAFG